VEHPIAVAPHLDEEVVARLVEEQRVDLPDLP
jgi:hypothetical protein